MTDQSHLCQPRLFIAHKLPQIAKQQTNIIYYHTEQLSIASACSHFFDIFLPLPTQYLHSRGTTIFNFFSHKNPLFFAVANAITFFLSKV